jgi:hypothetical protein
LTLKSPQTINSELVLYNGFKMVSMPFKKYEKSPVGTLYMAKIKILKDEICNLTAHAS